jgi:cation transport regulator
LLRVAKAVPAARSEAHTARDPSHGSASRAVHNFELPPTVRSHLPEHAQDIYREAFNHAFSAHSGDPRQEEAAHRIAWGAVKRRYVKEGDMWVERTS